MQNNRILEIVRILLQQSDYITIQTITQILQVSNKTIRNDLMLVDEYLKESSLTLSKKTGAGVRIQGDEEAKLRLLKEISQKSRQKTDYSPQARKIYLGLRIVNCEENCRIYELASELYVSRATIHKDLLALSEMLPPYRLGLIRKNNNGISIEGKERHLRDFMFDLMLEDNGYSKFVKIIKNADYPCENDFIFEALDYTDTDIHRLVQLIIHSGNNYINCLPFDSLVPALLRIFIIMVRNLDDHIVSLSTAFMQDLQSQPLYPESRHLALILEEEYQLHFSEEEIRYIQIHFLSLQNKNGIPKDEQQDARMLGTELLHYWEGIFHRPFSEDKDFLESLVAHLGPALTRYRHGISIKNPMMPEIRAYYQNTFQIVKKSMELLHDRYPYDLIDDELGYITIHLAAALERTKQPLKTILVCHGGSGASNLLSRKLTAQLSEIEIVSQESFLSIQNADLSEIDLIITTIELSLSAKIPVLTVNSLVHDYDVLRLKEIIKKYYNMKNTPLEEVSVENLPQ